MQNITQNITEKVTLNLSWEFQPLAVHSSEQ